MTDFLKHALNYNEDKRAIMKHAKNPVVVPEKFADHLKFIGDYDKAFRAANPKEALKREDLREPAQKFLEDFKEKPINNLLGGKVLEWRNANLK